MLDELKVGRNGKEKGKYRTLALPLIYNRRHVRWVADVDFGGQKSV